MCFCSCCLWARKLWTSKWRLAPVKEIPIPRLELLACFLLNKLIASVKIVMKNEVDIVRVFWWTDLQILLWWIRQAHNERKAWVQNSVEKIRKNVDSNAFCGGTVQSFCWSERRFDYPRISCCQKTKTLWKMWLIFAEKTLLALVVSKTLGLVKPYRSDIGHFGYLEKLLRVTGYKMRFARNLKKVFIKGKGINDESLLEEVENAKLLWVKYERSYIKNLLNYGKLKNSLL